MITEIQKMTFVDQIRTFVDAYLEKAARARKCDKNRLSIFMYLSSVNPPVLSNLLYEDNLNLISQITIKQVVTGLAGIFAGTIETSIIKGFIAYAKETNFDVGELKLRLSYKENNLVYQAFYQGKSIAVDLEKFFAKK